MVSKLVIEKLKPIVDNYKNSHLQKRPQDEKDFEIWESDFCLSIEKKKEGASCLIK